MYRTWVSDSRTASDASTLQRFNESLLRSRFLQNLAGSTETFAETIAVFLLQRGGQAIAIALILLHRRASIVDRVRWLIALRLDQPINGRSCETTGPENIGNMDPSHPIQPFALNCSLNRYRHTVDDHAVEQSSAFLGRAQVAGSRAR